MKVLVTGADGYIGSVLTPCLAERGLEVSGLDAGFYRDGRLYEDGRRRPPVVTRDIRDIVPEDVAGYDAVVHLAELSNDPLGEHDPAITHAINHQGSLRLALACKAAGVRRFVYTSSCSVYGAAPDGSPRDETSPTAPQTAYAACKLLVERDVGALADDRFAPVFLRNATAFGASPRMRFDIVLNNLAGLAWTRRTIAMTSDGTPWRPLVHVRDICEAIALALAAPAAAVRGAILNVGDDAQNYRVREIAEIVAAAFPGCRLTFGRPGADNRSYRVSFARIRQVLPAFRCRFGAEQGARELHELFRRIAMSEAVFAQPAFTRLAQLQQLRATGRLDAALRWRGTADAAA
ncbi:MAG: SDR family oxidoreductase [Dongiaceae bacterium]